MNLSTIANGTVEHDDSGDEASSASTFERATQHLEGLAADRVALIEERAFLLSKADMIGALIAKINGQTSAPPTAPAARPARAVKAEAAPRGTPGRRAKGGGTLPDIIHAYLVEHPWAASSDILTAVQDARPKTKPTDLAATLFRLKGAGRLKAKGKRGSMTYAVAG